jgi:hypothetical protein
MAVGAFVNAEVEKRGAMISEKRASDILEKTNKYLQLNTPPLRSELSAEISVMFLDAEERKLCLQPPRTFPTPLEKYLPKQRN